MESTTDALQRLWRDNDEDARRHDADDASISRPGFAAATSDYRAGYRDGLHAANARIRATLAGMRLSGHVEMRQAGPAPTLDTAPMADLQQAYANMDKGPIIDAETDEPDFQRRRLT